MVMKSRASIGFMNQMEQSESLIIRRIRIMVFERLFVEKAMHIIHKLNIMVSMIIISRVFFSTKSKSTNELFTNI